MSTAKLNVWITEFGDPCHIVDRDQWFVHITDCNGKVLEWCGKKFAFLPAKCGHLEIEIPPGCYTVFAGHNPQAKPGSFGNRLTHVQIVRANCGDHVCVTLYSPTASKCGTWFAHAVHTQRRALEAAGIDPELIQHTVKTVNKFVEALPYDRFTQNTAFALEDGPPAKGGGDEKDNYDEPDK